MYEDFLIFFKKNIFYLKIYQNNYFFKFLILIYQNYTKKGQFNTFLNEIYF